MQNIFVALKLFIFVNVMRDKLFVISLHDRQNYLVPNILNYLLQV